MSEIIEITDFNAPELDIYGRLREAQLYHYREPEPGLFIAESPIVIERALDAGYEPVSVLMEKGNPVNGTDQILMRCQGIPVYQAEPELLTGITGFHLTRGMLCAMKRKALPAMEEILRDARRITVLENVVNPTNVGAIMRSAAALNMDAVLLTRECSDPLYRRAIRVSMGTVFQIPWTIVKDDWQVKLHGLGFETCAMALTDNSISIRDPRLARAEKLAVIMGTEGEGLKKETIEACDHTVRIPMTHGVDSLNVAAASAVAFWQLGSHETS